MRKIVYVVGEPGVGKSTLIDRLTDAPYSRAPITGLRDPKRELILRDRVVVGVELGARRGRHPEGFPGTDAMSMSAIVGVEDWLVSGRAADETELIIGEGARLGVRRFHDAAVTAGWDFTAVLVEDEAGAAHRRRARGSQQASSWVRGATTRAHNFADYVQGQGSGVCRLGPNAPMSWLSVLREVTGLNEGAGG